MNRLRCCSRAVKLGKFLCLILSFISPPRILDFKRQFYQASQKYLALSYAEAIAESEKLDALTAAVICAILSPAG